MSFLEQLSKAYGLSRVPTRVLCCRYIGVIADGRVVATLDDALWYLDHHGDECVFALPGGNQVVVAWSDEDRLQLLYGPDYPIGELNQYSYQWYHADLVLPHFIDSTPRYLLTRDD